uniref:Uncharacterized protein n=1 Tax=Emiliania huxleyi TaxID=2903 RepID=A0A7S3SSY8_EMIHU
MCAGDDAAGLARKQRAAAAGAIQAVVAALQAHPHEAAVAALQAHPQVAEVQEEGCAALVNVCDGDDDAGLARKQRAAGAGAMELVVAAMQAHPQAVGVQQYGCWAMVNVCHRTPGAGLARIQRAADAGGASAGIELAVAAMQAHPQHAGVQQFGCCAMGNVCYGSDVAAPARRQRAVIAGAPEAAARGYAGAPGRRSC